MGTDIHLEAERRLDDGTWERIPHPEEPCWSCVDYVDQPDGTRERGEPRGWFHPWVTVDELQPGAVVLDRHDNDRLQIDEQRECYQCRGSKVVYPQWYHDRNYSVFAILADVRNGVGFAGVRTGAGYVPVCEQRGVPHDLSPQVRERLAETGYELDGAGGLAYTPEDEDAYDRLEKTPEGYWSLGEHSFSHVTLHELLEEYDWRRYTTSEGWVDPWNYEVFRRLGSPHSWSGGISGSSIEHVTAGHMAEMIDSGDIQFEGDDEYWLDYRGYGDRPYTDGLSRAMGEWSLPEGSVGERIRSGRSYYCPVEWRVSYVEQAEEFLGRMRELARLHAPDGDVSRVRIVFGFDS